MKHYRETSFEKECAHFVAVTRRTQINLTLSYLTPLIDASYP